MMSDHLQAYVRSYEPLPYDMGSMTALPRQTYTVFQDGKAVAEAPRTPGALRRLRATWPDCEIVETINERRRGHTNYTIGRR